MYWEEDVEGEVGSADSGDEGGLARPRAASTSSPGRGRAGSVGRAGGIGAIRGLLDDGMDEEPLAPQPELARSTAWRDGIARVARAGFPDGAPSPLLACSGAELRQSVDILRNDSTYAGVRMVALRRIVRQLMDHAQNKQGAFNVPVDHIALCVPTYPEVIQEPMDLGTVLQRTEQGYYSADVPRFRREVNLVFDNAMLFNPTGHFIHTSALALSTYFNDRMGKLEGKGQADLERQATHAAAGGCSRCLGRTCHLCTEGCLQFAPPALRCSGPCKSLIRRGCTYHTTPDHKRPFCQACFRRLCGAYGVSAAALEKTKGRGGGAGGAADDAGDAAGDVQPPLPRGRGRIAGGVNGMGGRALNNGIPVNLAPFLLSDQDTQLVDPATLTQQRFDWNETEQWVHCETCDRHVHAICTLYDVRRGMPEDEPSKRWADSAPVVPASSPSMSSSVSSSSSSSRRSGDASSSSGGERGGRGKLSCAACLSCLAEATDPFDEVRPDAPSRSSSKSGSSSSHSSRSRNRSRSSSGAFKESGLDSGNGSAAASSSSKRRALKVGPHTSALSPFAESKCGNDDDDDDEDAGGRMRRRSPRARLGQVKSEGNEYLIHGETSDGHDTKRGVKRSLGDGAPMSSLDALAAGRGGARCDARALPHTVMTRFMEAWLAERLRERMAGDSDFEGEEKSMNDLLDSLSVRTISTTEESIDMEPEVRRGFDLRRPHPHAPPTWLEYVAMMHLLFHHLLFAFLLPQLLIIVMP